METLPRRLQQTIQSNHGPLITKVPPNPTPTLKTTSQMNRIPLKIPFHDRIQAWKNQHSADALSGRIDTIQIKSDLTDEIKQPETCRTITTFADTNTKLGINHNGPHHPVAVII